MAQNDTKVRGQDVVELFATSLGFAEKCEPFNLSEWYGFKNAENKILRAKLSTTQDKTGCYNIHASDKLSECYVYCIIQTINKFTVIKISKFENNKFVVNSNLEVKSGKEDGQFARQEFEHDGRLYLIKEISETIYGIRNRVDSNEPIDEKAIRELLEIEPQERSCAYCGISPEQLEKLNANAGTEFGLTSRGRGKKLEVDQIQPKKGYVKDNMTLCCYWCNNAKTDTFSVLEFKEIARGINKVWNKRLGSEEEVTFPEDSPVWGK